MRAPFRTGLLALLCALMLGIATIANANIPGRPIDRPEGPPDPDPTMVGDPDDGQGSVIIVLTPWRAYSVRLGWIRFSRVQGGVPESQGRFSSRHSASLSKTRGGHAR